MSNHRHSTLTASTAATAATTTSPSSPPIQERSRSAPRLDLFKRTSSNSITSLSLRQPASAPLDPMNPPNLFFVRHNNNNSSSSSSSKSSRRPQQLIAHSRTSSLPAPFPQQQSYPPIEFQILPIAPASFERRRRRSNEHHHRQHPLENISTATSMTDFPVLSRRQTSPPAPPSLSRQSSLSVDTTLSQTSAAAAKLPSAEIASGVYGWNKTEAAQANREYVEFMKSKGVHVSSIRHNIDKQQQQTYSGVNDF
ncbi:hypothetical protein HK100_002404 [Physocladia obscura]|uniref:Uncharacterized protein n=1 Tax=Physocladia obscura TaxID=109957 RepID=A0AAD5T861_9FUNG|nr:hypothetical protein HK100_002404 [Physocladia obscura]